MTLPEDFDRASIIACCKNPLPENVVGHHGKRVIKISDHHVVKSGPDVTKEEAENQRIAYERLDSRIVRVPRVYAFFTDDKDYGYIVMEFVKGKVINPLEDDTAIEKVASMLGYLATFRHTIPGPLGGGVSRGLLFSETHEVNFGSLDGMEQWFNTRLFAHNPKLTFQGCELVLCHLDIAPRNILWQEDGTFCLVDWASAGFYPRLFEFCAQWIVEGREGSFESKILKLMKPLPDHELAQKEAFLCAWSNIQKYPFRSEESKLQDELAMAAIFPQRSGPAPVPPMPDYPPEWYEQAEREGITLTKPTSMKSSSSLPATGKQNGLRSRLARFLRAIFCLRSRSSESD